MTREQPQRLRGCIGKAQVANQPEQHAAQILVGGSGQAVALLRH